MAAGIEFGAIAIEYASFQHRALDQSAGDLGAAIDSIMSGPMGVLEILQAQNFHVDFLSSGVRAKAIQAGIRTILIALDAEPQASAVAVFAFIGVGIVERGVPAQAVQPPIAETAREYLLAAMHHAQAGGVALDDAALIETGGAVGARHIEPVLAADFAGFAGRRHRRVDDVFGCGSGPACLRG